ncbi:hypothetical protein BDD12DRAFT_850522 [Trichophaea hybrida]|nr:hypothetical protein BDD12DRAFT_850522 [Trichophaea hybrida]
MVHIVMAFFHPHALITLLSLVSLIFIQPSTQNRLPAFVHLRIEGVNETIFSGDIETRGHDVTVPPYNVTRHCDGTNNNRNPSPGATVTSALDDAARYNGFGWSGRWYDTFDDFFITSIGSDSDSGGHTRATGNDVLIGFDKCGKHTFLKMEPNRQTVRVNEPVVVRVTNGSTGMPISGARVGTATTGDDGRATLIYSTPGPQILKAEKYCTVRSDKAVVIVLAENTATEVGEDAFSSSVDVHGEISAVSSSALGTGDIGGEL